ncbi:MAG: tRNA pseudouridine(38-40) synthase TruA [Chloroflexi bacterium]|nr:tRNA pseudouridine(38-40) synthase TruA [Chloroflexota bacterium]
MRIALRLEYDGTDFRGSQLQAKDRTVQSAIEDALHKLFQQPIRPYMASRTDSGVHARDQVAAFDVSTYLDMNTVTNAMNSHLPHDVAVVSSHHVDAEFYPRRDAVSREYTYTINNSQIERPLIRRLAATVYSHLDEAAMSRSAKLFEGANDFASFAGPSVLPGAPTIRRMMDTEVTRKGDTVTIWFKANAFLHQQIRRMVGTLVELGKAKMTEQDFAKLLEQPRKGAGTVLMAPHGLCLTKINYPETGPGALPA